MSADKTFIDTNILIYAFTSDEPEKQKTALEFLDNCQPVISTQVLKEFSNVMLKKGKIDSEVIKEIISEIVEITEVVIEDPALVFNSFDVQKIYGFSFYDSLIVATALNAQCQVLLSEDLQDSQIIDGCLRIVNPFR